jgi:hypothetical protein
MARTSDLPDLFSEEEVATMRGAATAIYATEAGEV